MTMGFRKFRPVLLAIAAVCAAPAIASAATISTMQTYDFSGVCFDCTGLGKAELVVKDYTPGTLLSQSNFVSFHYDGTDLLPAYTIAGDEAFRFAGELPVALPGPASVGIFAADRQFFSAASGFWCTGNSCAADRGGASTWSSGTPEPASWALLLTGFFGLGAMVRRARHATAGLLAA